MRVKPLLVLALLVSACTTPPGQMKTVSGDMKGYKAFSWGKAGVTYKEYDDVAFLCTGLGVLTPDKPKPQDTQLQNTTTDDAFAQDRLINTEQQQRQAEW